MTCLNNSFCGFFSLCICVVNQNSVFGWLSQGTDEYSYVHLCKVLLSGNRGLFLVTRGHIPALLLGQIPLPAHLQCFAQHVRTQVQLCARVSSPGIHLLKLLAQTVRSQILFVCTFVWSAHRNMWVWDLETAVLTNATRAERGEVQLGVHEQMEKTQGFLWYLGTKCKKKLR